MRTRILQYSNTSGQMLVTNLDLPIAALGACSCITFRIYADRKIGITQKAHDRDCDSLFRSSIKINRIDRVVNLVGSFGAKQRQYLLEIADKCPVGKSLHGQIHVVTRLGQA